MTMIKNSKLIEFKKTAIKLGALNKRILKSLFAIIGILFGIIISFTLQAQEYYVSPGRFIDDICAKDIDLDNDIDLIVCSSDGSTDTLYIFTNDGNGKLTGTAYNRICRIHAECGIVDDDPYPDIISAGPDGALFLKNNGDGTFAEAISIAPPSPSRVTEYIIDMDNDGLNDLIYTYNAYYRKWGILKNEGNLIFTDHIIFDSGMGGNLDPSVGNLNGDILPDVCLAFLPTGTHYLINNGDLTFDTTLLCSTGTNNAYVCDLNSSQPKDIELFSVNTQQLFLYENLGNATFHIRDTLPLNGPVLITSIADYNNDGLDDYAYAICWWDGCTDSIYVSLNNGDWGYIPAQHYFVGQMELFRTETADLNNDGYNDIIMYGYSPQNAFKVLWNDGTGHFSYDNTVGESELQRLKINFTINILPNPFTTNTSIHFISCIEGHCCISIMNLYGVIVKTSGDIEMNGNINQEFKWDGRDNAGRVIPAGIYVVEFYVKNSCIASRKIVKY